MSIGWVMFWKAVVLGVWAAFLERWQAKKEAYRANGMELRQNPKTGTYEAYCPYTRVERAGRIFVNFIYSLVFVWWMILLYFFATGQKKVLGDYLIRLLTA